MRAYEIRPYEPGDRDGILATFNRVFAEDAGRPPRTVEEWEWTYAANPAGRRVWVAVDGDVVAAHYAALPARVRLDGEEALFGQIIDSMVHPDYRRGLKRPGLFVTVAQRMLEATCAPDKMVVTYGWPTPEAWRVGKAWLDYEMVRREASLTRSPGAGPRETPAGVVELADAGTEVDALYERCAAAWGASTIRDAAWLRWRVLERPGRPYRVFAVPRAPGIPGTPGAERGLAGYAVYRTGDWPVPGSAVLCDWLVPEDERGAGDLLLEACLARARVDGASTVVAGFPGWSAWFLRFQERGFFVGPSEYLMSGRNTHPRYDMFWLRDHWWYQALDLDLC